MGNLIGIYVGAGFSEKIVGLIIVLAVLAGLILCIKIMNFFVENPKEECDQDAAEGISGPDLVKAEVSPEIAGFTPIEKAVEKRGITEGKTVIKGVSDEKILAAIMAAVSFDLNVPLSSLKFKSIRQLK